MTDPQPAVTDPAVTAQITTLSDTDAIRVLAVVLDDDGRRFDPIGWRTEEPHLQEAVADPDLAPLAQPDSAPPSDGDLARAALLYLTDTDPQLIPLITREATRPAADTAEKFDPVTLAIGGLVVLALQTDITLERTAQGRWKFRFHKQAMKDSTLGRLLGKLISYSSGQ